MRDNHDTQPSMPSVSLDDGVGAPPRFLFWGVIGIFIFLVAGGLFGLFALNNLLSTGQQQRVVQAIPFMDAFVIRQPTPQGGILPTPVLSDAANSAALDLLATPEDTDGEDEPVEGVDETDEVAVTIVPTATAVPTTVITATSPPTATAMSITTATPVGDGDSSSGAGVQDGLVSGVSIGSSARMFGFRHYQQTWNNCGPATITMALSYYGWQNNQAYAESYLKPVREDKNVSPQELVDFVNERSSVRALWRMGGNLDLLRRLIYAEFPVVIESGLMPEAYEWIGHYRALVAYDDTLQRLYMYDSFLGSGEADEGIYESYTEVDEKWRHFNRIFIVIYEPSREAELMAILGDLASVERSAEIAFEVARGEARENPQDNHAWFNMGTSLVALGRYEEAANAFDQARRHGLHFRMTWYQFGPFVAYYETGRFDDVMALTQSNLNNASELQETYYWRGRVLMAQGDNANAASEFRRALRYNPNYEEAREALAELNS